MLKLISLILISTAFSQVVIKKKDQEIKLTQARKTIINKPDDLQIKLGAFYTTGVTYRGALIWEAPVGAVGPSLTFYDKFRLGRGGLSYFKKFNKRHVLTTGSSFFADDEPRALWIKLEGAAKDFKNQRKTTFGAYIDYAYTFKRAFSFKSQIHKDLQEHHGYYFFNQALVSFIPLIAFGIEVGIGEKSANRYVYGDTANAGHAHNNYFMSVLVPFLPYNGIMILKYSNHEILDKNNYNADYIGGRSVHNQFTAVALWDI